MLIGAGRSGSSLFMRMLDSHPRIRYFAETQFLLARIWHGVWENPLWFNYLNFPRHFPAFPTEFGSSLETDTVRKRSTDESMLDGQRQRVASLLRQLFGDIMELGSDVDAWGYKEVWNGNDAVACYPWDSYNAVFPEATWVHLVRHPFDFLKSVARWNLTPLTEEFVAHELSHWVQMLEWNRRQSTLRKYIEIRYEDLVREPKKTLLPVFSMADIEWSEDCLGPLSRSYLKSRQSSRLSPAPPLTHKKLKHIVAQFDGLPKLLDDLGYCLPETFPQDFKAP
jgi:hypothetical protein